MTCDAPVIQQEVLQLVSYTTVNGAFFGIVFNPYCNCAVLMIGESFAEAISQGRVHVASFIFSSLITVCATRLFEVIDVVLITSS